MSRYDVIDRVEDVESPRHAALPGLGALGALAGDLLAERVRSRTGADHAPR